MSKSFSAKSLGMRTFSEIRAEIEKTEVLESRRHEASIRCAYCDQLGGTIWTWRLPGNAFTDSAFKCDNPLCDAFNMPPYNWE